MEDIINHFLGFMPTRTVFFAAIGTFLLSLTIQYVHTWFKNVTRLPWMKEENQRNRQQILQESRQLPNEKKIDNA